MAFGFLFMLLVFPNGDLSSIYKYLSFTPASLLYIDIRIGGPGLGWFLDLV